VRRFLAGFYSWTTILVVVSYGPGFFHHGDKGRERFNTRDCNISLRTFEGASRASQLHPSLHRWTLFRAHGLDIPS